MAIRVPGLSGLSYGIESPWRFGSVTVIGLLVVLVGVLRP